MASFAKYIGGSPTNTAVGASRLGLRSGLLTRVGRRPFRPLHPRAAGARGRFHPGRDRGRRTADRAGVPGHPRPGHLPADLLSRELRGHGPASGRRRSGVPRIGRRGADQRHPSVAAQCVRCQPSRLRNRARSGRQGRVRHRLPPGAVGADRQGRGREPLRRPRRGHRAPAGSAAAVRPDRRHGRGSAHPRRQHRHDRRPARDPRENRRAAGVQARRPGLFGVSGGHSRPPRRGGGRAWIQGRGVQRARRGRRVHGRLPARLAARRDAGDLLRATPTPAGPSSSRATAARRRCRPGRSCSSSWASDEHPFRLRDDAALEQTHWAGTRVGRWDELTVLAMDHRSQFEAICEKAGADPARIERSRRWR